MTYFAYICIAWATALALVYAVFAATYRIWEEKEWEQTAKSRSR